MDAAPAALLDLGNRHLKLLWPGAAVPRMLAWAEPGAPARLASLLAERLEPGDGIWLASSAPQAEPLLAPAWEGYRLRLLGPEDVPLPRRTEGTGLDRLLAGYAAWQEQPTRPVLVASLGTAFTLDLVSADGHFLGGAIGPGLGVQRQALDQACPHLGAGRSSRETPPRVTATAVDAGTRRGLAACIQGLAAEFASGLQQEPRRLVHGGDAEELAPLLVGWETRHQMVLGGMARLAAAVPSSPWPTSGA